MLAGFSIVHLRLKSINGETVSMASPFFGAFVDTPLGLKPNWFVNLQIQYQKNSYSTYKSIANHNQDLLVNTTALGIPILVSYRSSSKKFRPFINAGPSLTYYLNRQNDLYDATVSSSLVEITRTSLNSISRFQLCGIIGIGTEYSITLRKALGIEVRYANGSGLGVAKKPVSSLQVLTSLFF
jgi:hypothetical protein